jgi:SSS family solute:Na+ symporter
MFTNLALLIVHCPYTEVFLPGMQPQEAGIGGVVILRWLWDRINLYSEIAAIATSLAVAPLILATVETEWIRLGIMVLASLGAAVGITYVTPATNQSVLQNFCTKVRPMGRWEKTGVDDNSNSPKLKRHLKPTILMTISLFLILIGLVRLLIPLPWISLLWSWGTLLAGVALAPLWWRALGAKTIDPPVQKE